jgi:hypothetical protein
MTTLQENGRRYLVITNSLHPVQIEANSRSANFLFDVCKEAHYWTFPPTPTHQDLPPLERYITELKQQLHDQTSLWSRITNHVPFLKAPTLNESTRRLYQALHSYYQQKSVELFKTPEDVALCAILTKLHSIQESVAPLEYCQLLHFIDDTKDSGGLAANETVILEKIARLQDHINHVKASSPEHQLTHALLDLRGPFDKHLSSAMIDLQRDELKSLRENASSWNASLRSTPTQIKQAETKLHALLFLHYNTIDVGSTSNPIETQQIKQIMSRLQVYTHSPVFHLAKVDYCAILNKLDQTILKGRLTFRNDAFLEEIHKDIDNLHEKLHSLNDSAEGRLNLLSTTLKKDR